jgi:hypothetical protein
MNDRMIREIAEHQTMDFPKKPIIQKFCERQMLFCLIIGIISFYSDCQSICFAASIISPLIYMTGKKFTKGWISD